MDGRPPCRTTPDAAVFARHRNYFRRDVVGCAVRIDDLAYLSFWALRLQIAYLYADSAIAKMGVEDWQNGSALYYIVRDRSFGSSGPLTPIWLWLSDQSLTTLALTWGAIAIELAIALFTLLDARWRLAAFWLGLALHALTFLSMGLFSFSLVMVAVAALIATPGVAVLNRPQQLLSRDRLTAQNDLRSLEANEDARGM